MSEQEIRDLVYRTTGFNVSSIGRVQKELGVVTAVSALSTSSQIIGKTGTASLIWRKGGYSDVTILNAYQWQPDIDADADVDATDAALHDIAIAAASLNGFTVNINGVSGVPGTGTYNLQVTCPSANGAIYNGGQLISSNSSILSIDSYAAITGGVTGISSPGSFGVTDDSKLYYGKIYGSLKMDAADVDYLTISRAGRDILKLS